MQIGFNLPVSGPMATPEVMARWRTRRNSERHSASTT
jgi:hypothetical protein